MIRKSRLTPKPFQEEGIKYLMDNPYCILGDEMGLGKTFQFISLVLLLQKKAIVVCPAYLVANWREEILKVCVGEDQLDLFRITSYSSFSKIYDIYDEENHPRIICFDEAHFLKTPKAKRTEAYMRFISAARLDRVVLMSGTPIKNRVSEWYILFKIIYSKRGNSKFLDRFPTPWDFNTYFCFAKKGKLLYGGRTRTYTKFSGVKNREELKALASNCMLRRKSKDVLQLKTPTHMHITANVKNVQDEVLIKAFESGVNSTGKRLSARAKADFTLKYLENICEPFIIFSCHPSVCEVIKKRTERVAIVTGKTPVEHRSEIVRQFQGGLFDGIVATIGSMSTGFTLTRAEHIIFNDMSYVVGDNAQAVARAHRIGQEKALRVHYINGSKVDGRINRALESKEKELKLF